MKTKLWQRTVSTMLAVTLGIFNIESTGLFSNILPLSNMYAAAEDGYLQQVYFKISGNIDFDESTADGNNIDWKGIVRPAVFDQKIYAERIYEYNGVEYKETVPTQAFNKQEDFYLKFENDGEGGGSFVIDNVPAYVYKDGETCKVLSYRLKVDSSHEWYKYETKIEGNDTNTGFIDLTKINNLNNFQALTTIVLRMQTQRLTIIPTVIPEDSDTGTAFTFSNVFGSPKNIVTANGAKTLNFSATASSNREIVIDVPIGVSYKVNQTEKDGYKLNSDYTIIIGEETSTNSKIASGTIDKGKDVTVITSNFSRNLTKNFNVKWIDNNSLSRPEQTAEKYSEWFTINYKIEDGSWKELTETDLELLGLEKMPELKLTETGAYYSGLSPADPIGKPIQYEVVLKSIKHEDTEPPEYILPDGYRADITESEDVKTFTFTEIIDYKATVKWNDDTDREHIRPKSIKELLEFHCVSEKGIDKVIKDIDIDITQSDTDANLLNISVSGLPRYDENNYEYDYYIVQKTIDVTREPNLKNLSYNTYYENGTGAYGNDIEKCHNNGTITEVLSSETDFSAQKQWLDPDADKSKRPDATVTLWRYVKSDDLTDQDGDEDIDLDDAYIKGVVSQVMINEGIKDKEKPLSYSLSKNEDSSVKFSIDFNSDNISDMSETFTLPGNDDKGQEYVYFVRESLSGENADHYDIHYVDGEKDEYGNEITHKYGTLSGGTIKNVQSERVAVNVKKVWKNPESLSDIDGASVQMIISAPVLNTDTFKELKIYSEEENSHEILGEDEQILAQTIKGFTVDIPFSEVTYYADRYDVEGNELDMSRAVFKEIVKDENGNPISTDYKDDGSFFVKGTKYIPSIIVGDTLTLGDGTNQYSYTQINTAKPTRDYKLIKTWGKGINAQDYADIGAVVFQLERISVNDLAKGSNNYEIVKEYLVQNEDDATWESIINGLDKYDDNGIQYYYRAKEIGFEKTDGTRIAVGAKKEWSVLYHRSYDQTEAVNYISTTGGGYFTLTKLWQDNSDISGRDDTVVRVYKKTELKDALEQKYNGSESDKIVDIASLGVEYKEITLTEEKNKYYTAEYSFDSPYKRSDFFVIEYSVGSESSNPKPAQYTYDELINALNSSGYYSYSGTVENDNFRFDVNTVCNSEGDLMIVNTRKGETSISVSKKWKDPENEGYRPQEIQFQLYQNEKPYTNTNVDKTVKISGAKIDENGIITVEPGSDKNGWGFTVSNLPMFSADGERLYYDIDEIPAKNTSNVSYIQKKVETKLDGDEKNQAFTFNFENTITGTTSHVAYKYWKDAAVPQSNRPDIYFILYRYLKGSDPNSAEQYIDYKTQLWTMPSNADDYDLKVTIEDLPRFNEEGIEYVYYFKEQLNNDGESVYGKYHGTSETVDLDDGTTYEVFTNTIVDYMTISGTKVWKGFTGLQIKDVEGYPDPVIRLYRSSKKVSDDLSNFQDWDQDTINENGFILVDEVELNSGKKSYNFPNGKPENTENYIYVDGKYMLPKFDENGERYKYIVKESFDEEITDLLYTKSNANGTLTNEFKDTINRCSIKVNKEWERDILDTEDEYPSVKFYLYRNIYKIIDNESVLVESLLYDVRTITADQFKAANGDVFCVFDDLLIFSPKGEEYTYEIVEKDINGRDINGYSVTYYNTYPGESSGNNGEISVNPHQIFGKDWINKTLSEIEVGAKNTYKKEHPAQLSGKKFWNDRHDTENLRPSDIQLTLKRSTGNEPGQNNGIKDSELTILPVYESVTPDAEGPYIVWNKNGSEKGIDKWEYTVYNLERYAPNGLPYVYTLEEEMDRIDGIYKKSPDAVGSAENSEFIKMSDMVNEFEKNLKVKKVWHDGDNVYGLRPENVTIQLQCSTDGGATWEPYQYKDDNGELVVAEKILTEKADSLPNTNGSTWQYIFDNLPSQNCEGLKYIYRCEETMLDGLDVNSPGVPYECKYTKNDDSYYTLENELKPTSLVVEKIWNDEDNLYNSRPDSVRFMLQKQVVDDRIYHTWIKDENGNNVLADENGNILDEWIDVKEFTLPDEKGSWKTTKYNLPIAQILKDENNNEYRVYSLYFRAVELDSEGNYGNPPNYEMVQKHEYKDSQNHSVITNNLIINDPSTITVKKTWYKSDDKPVTAKFELLYQTIDEDENTWHCYGSNSSVDINKMGGHTSKGCLTKEIKSDSDVQEVSWTNLPEKDRDGKKLRYKVVEYPIDNFRTIVSNKVESETDTYNFTNIEEQEFEVVKKWKNTSYAHKNAEDNFTSKFVLQWSTDNGVTWEDVPDTASIVLTSENANATESGEWQNLPKFTNDGKSIKYRARETEINGIPVVNDTNGDYIVTYSENEEGTQTVSENRMIYGFVNLSKMSAYFSDSVVSGGKNLENVVFDIYACDSKGEPNKEPYVSNVKTDDKGNLKCKDGKYGDEEKYLISGTYLLKEKSTNPDFSIWYDGVKFTVGNTGVNNTGEHGTAWIKTILSDDEKSIRLAVDYIEADDVVHSFNDSCSSKTEANAPAYNIESRGVIQFTKTGNKTDLDIHPGSANETPAYFAVYADDVQVAGLVSRDETDEGKVIFVLTNLDKDKKALDHDNTPVQNAAGIPYLRNTDGVWTLLSGTYTIKEIVPPAGYKLDPTTRTAVIKKIDSVTNSDTVSLYKGNIAKIEDDTDYKWENNPNTVKIYKKDQYGRDVVLGNDKYLVLRIDDEEAKFPTGENEIYLYQNKSKPATDTKGNIIENYISYDEEGKNWVITKLFDSSKTYTLSEPAQNVPDAYVQADEIKFKVTSEGIMNVDEGATPVSSPTLADGDDYKSYYQSNADGNILVMRDTSRYLLDVGLKKQDMSNNNIANISFELYKYSETDAEGNPNNPVSVLPKDVLLTTNSEGEIILSTPRGIKNQITGSDLIYGLDYGKYYFHEVERGASDGYVLGNDIYFEIVKKQGSDNEKYRDYAEVVFDTEKNSMVSQDENSHIGVVKNKPVIEKHIELTKTDSKNKTKTLAGAEFTLEYLSITDKQTGSSTNGTAIKVECITDENGILRLKDNSYPDISMKGHYVLTETKAPEKYMTPTHQITRIEFDVDSDNKIKNVKISGACTILDKDENALELDDEQTLKLYDGETLNLNVQNEETVVNISKINDIFNKQKTKGLNGEALSGAVLEIYEEGKTESVATLSEYDKCEPNGMVTKSADNRWKLTGVLKENTVYILHEAAVPVGYMRAEDIKFKIYGTNNQKQSVVYVLNGTDWSTTENLKNNVLTMVDEAIIAPVDAQKVIHYINKINEKDEKYEALENAVFDVFAENADTVSKKIGTAKSGSDGFLIWKEIEWENAESLVYNSAGKRVTEEDSDTVIGHTIILMQNKDGYTFKETGSPVNAYNENYKDSPTPKSYNVKITDENYKVFKQNSDSYIDIVQAQKIESHEVASTESRDYNASADDLVNPEFTSKVKLHKYDSDEEANRAAIPNTEFTLYKKGSTQSYDKALSGGVVSVKGKFYTDNDGNLEIEIREKGDYTLVETKAAAGYVNSEAVLEFTLDDSDYDKTKSLKKNNDDIPNERQLGEVTLIKTDEGTGEYLNGVVYTLTRTDSNAENGNNPFNKTIDLVTGNMYTAVKNGSAWEITTKQAEDGKIILVGLNWGEYKLVEKTELSGYKLDKTELIFTIDCRDNNYLTFNPKPLNSKNMITFHKQSSEDGKKALAGAVFNVLDSSGKIVEFYLSDKDGATKVTEAVSDENGNVTVYGLPTNIDSDTPVTYYLKEIEAPKGYILKKEQIEQIEFTVDRYGNIRESSYVKNVLTMENDPIKIFIKKFSENTSDELNGAKFEITDICDECKNGGKLANGDKSFEIEVINSGDMIPIEKVIGGHKYRLTETTAPDGYEATAIVDFTVDVYGNVTIDKTAGGYTSETISSCATAVNNTDKTATINIRDEIIRATLTKFDYDDPNTVLSGVEFTLEPYGTGSSFTTSEKIYSFKTGSNGEFKIPDGLLKHDNEYLLRETKTMDGYYLSKEAQDGVILKVNKNGSFDIERLPAYEKLNPESCPISCNVDQNGVARLLIAYNKKAASFELTKNVKGNMGDLNGEFNIEITAYEVYKADDSDKTDEIEIGSKEIILGLGDKYDSENGENAFGTLPVGAKIEIRENNDLDYQAVVVLKDDELIEAVDGVVTVILDDSSTKLEIELVNLKNVPIDMGVDIDANTVIPIAALMMLSAWLYIRSRRKRDLI